jgi:hypothetical protein
MNIERLILWSRKASSLRQKYQHEKKHLLKNSQQLFLLITKRQYPLYNNIINFAGLALSSIPNNENSLESHIKHQLVLFVDFARETQTLLKKQLRAIEKKDKKTVVKLWKKELHLEKLMRRRSKKSYKLLKRLFKKTKHLQEKASLATIQARTFLTEHKSTFKWIYLGSFAILVFCTLSGTSFGVGDDLNKIIRYSSKLLSSA